MKGYKQLCLPCVLFICCGVQGIQPPRRSLLRDALRCGADDTPIGHGANFVGKHEIVEDKVLFSRWRSLTSRLVRFPNGRVVDFDIVGQAGSNRAVLIFAWDTRTKTATLVQEYMPGGHALKAGVAAGMVDDKHSDEGTDDPILTAAKFELEEECHLVGGTWLQLTDDTQMDKYSSVIVRVFLVLDPLPAINPRPLDDEEDITVMPNVTIPEIHDLIAKGEMNAVGGWACMVAIQRLRELGEII